MPKITSKVIADGRLKLELDTALAMPCIVREDSRRKPQTCTTAIDASKEQSDSEKTGASGKVERQQMDHIAEKVMWEAFTMAWYISQFPLVKKKLPEAKAAVDKEWEN